MARKYGVKVERGPAIVLAPHRRTPASHDEFRAWVSSIEGPTSADLFCGCGGLSLGLEAAGYTSVIGVDQDAYALETYNNLFPGLALNRDLAAPEVIDELVELLVEAKVDLIAGGPPCQPFSKAGRSRIRELAAKGLRDAHDVRRDLWQSFVEIICRVKPAAAIMENVPELALSDDMRTIRSIVDELELEGYSVAAQIISGPEQGVPQFRQRVILVALRDGATFDWPEHELIRPTLGSAIADLPPVNGGWLEAGNDRRMPYEPDLMSEFVTRMRAGVPDADKSVIFDHVTRAVRPDDREIFAQMDSKMKYSEIPDELKRYRDDIFDDKYKRLDLNAPSRSITAHIAKDGYWYIHPTQDRTITIREAARLQTFPDRARFAGPATAAFRQIGNAVPPRLGERIGTAVLRSLSAGEVAAEPTHVTSTKLAAWFDRQDSLSVPWLSASSPWTVIQGEILFGRANSTVIRSGWPLVQNLVNPKMTLARADIVQMSADIQEKPDRADQLIEAASWFLAAQEDGVDPFEDAKSMALNPFVNDHTARLAELVACPDSDGPILTTGGILRVAARYTGQPVDVINRGSDGRIAVSRLVGGSVLRTSNREACKAQAALLELANNQCNVKRPSCELCPLEPNCDFAANRQFAQATLQLE